MNLLEMLFRRRKPIGHILIMYCESGACYLAVEYDGVHIGCAGVKYIENGHGEGWWYIGDESMRGRGIGSALIAQLVNYAELELGFVQRARSYVLETNIACQSRAAL